MTIENKEIQSLLDEIQSLNNKVIALQKECKHDKVHSTYSIDNKGKFVFNLTKERKVKVVCKLCGELLELSTSDFCDMVSEDTAHLERII